MKREDRFHPTDGAILDEGEASRNIVPSPFAGEISHVFAAATASERRLRALRLAADIVASLTDRQATHLYQRLTGQVPGSVMELLEF